MKFNLCPFAPEINACGSLDHFSDVGATHARGSFEKVEVAVVEAFDEFGMGYAAHKSKRAHNLTIQFFQNCFVRRSTGNGASGKYAAFVIYVERWFSIMMCFCKDGLTIDDEGVEVVYLSGVETFKSIEKFPFTERVYPL